MCFKSLSDSSYRGLTYLPDTNSTSLLTTSFCSHFSTEASFSYMGNLKGAERSPEPVSHWMQGPQERSVTVSPSLLKQGCQAPLSAPQTEFSICRLHSRASVHAKGLGSSGLLKEAAAEGGGAASGHVPRAGLTIALYQHLVFSTEL